MQSVRLSDSIRWRGTSLILLAVATRRQPNAQPAPGSEPDLYRYARFSPEREVSAPPWWTSREATIPRVDAWRQSVARGHPEQEFPEPGPLGRVKIATDRIVMGERHRPDFAEQRPALVGEVQRGEPTVGGIPAPFQQPPFRETVDQGDQPARRGTQPGRHGLLAQPRLTGDQPEQPGLRRGQVERGDPLGKPPRGFRAYLGEQEGRAVRRRDAHFHVQKISR